MSWDRGNPIDQDSIKEKASHKAQRKGLLRAFFQDNEEKGNKGNPRKKRKVELWKGNSCKDSRQACEEKMGTFNLQIE